MAEDIENLKKVSDVNKNSAFTPDLLALVCRDSVWSHLHSLEDTPALRLGINFVFILVFTMII